MESRDLVEGLGISSSGERSRFLLARNLLEFCNYKPKIFEKILNFVLKHNSANFPNSLSSPYFFFWNSKMVFKWLREEVFLLNEENSSNIESAFRGLHGAFLLSEEFKPDEFLHRLASGLPEEERPKSSEQKEMCLSLCTNLLKLYEDFLLETLNQEAKWRNEMQSDELFQEDDEEDDEKIDIDGFQDNARDNANQRLYLQASNADDLFDKPVKAAFYNVLAVEETEMSNFNRKVPIEKQLHHLCRRFHSKCLEKQEEVKLLFQSLTQETKRRRQLEDQSAPTGADSPALLVMHGSTAECHENTAPGTATFAFPANAHMKRLDSMEPASLEKASSLVEKACVDISPRSDYCIIVKGFPPNTKENQVLNIIRKKSLCPEPRLVSVQTESTGSMNFIVDLFDRKRTRIRYVLSNGRSLVLF